MKKTLSCESLHHAVYAAPDVLRHCCKRFFVDGKMKGDVEICSAASDESISYDVIKEQKKKLYDDINQGKETECSGCPWLTKDEWPTLDKLDISHISIENHSVCNLRCTYCSDVYFGGKLPSYDIKVLFKELSHHKAIREKFSLVWGGGESVLLDSFETIFPYLTNQYNPAHNHVFTNATTYSPGLEESLRQGKVSITTSIDAGTVETFTAVRGKDKLFATLENLKKYHEAGGDSVTIKYILVPENIAETELAAFIGKIKEFDLAECSFQISSDFKDEAIGDNVIAAATFLFDNLKSIGATLINFDYHLRPRIDKFYADKRQDNSGIDNIFDDVIVWGAGEYAMRMLEQKSLQDKIKFFVDSDPEKQGGKIEGIVVKPPGAILAEKNAFVFIASMKFHRDIYRELISMGVSADKVIDATNF